MGREKKTKRLHSQSIYEDWLAGKNHRLKGGEVIRSKSPDSKLGVIGYAMNEMETYTVKWHLGPKPWDVIESIISSSQVIITTEKNPIKYKWSERIPGPGSDEIDRLEAIFDKVAVKNRTAREVEIHTAILEEELSSKKKSLTVDETKVDSIVDETLDEDTDAGMENSGIDSKIKGILEEE